MAQLLYGAYLVQLCRWFVLSGSFHGRSFGPIFGISGFSHARECIQRKKGYSMAWYPSVPYDLRLKLLFTLLLWNRRMVWDWLCLRKQEMITVLHCLVSLACFDPFPLHSLPHAIAFAPAVKSRLPSQITLSAKGEVSCFALLGSEAAKGTIPYHPFTLHRSPL